jgi:hypothetical protein
LIIFIVFLILGFVSFPKKLPHYKTSEAPNRSRAAGYNDYDKIIGFIILNFEKRFEHLNKSEKLSITATIAQIDKAIEAEG